jgi:hypothetical protein
MVFEWKSEAHFHRVPKLTPGPANVYFGESKSFASYSGTYHSPWLISMLTISQKGDVFTSSTPGAANPLTGSMFFLDYSEHNDPVPKYDYDETGVVLKGMCPNISFQIYGYSCRILLTGILQGELHIKDENGNEAKLQPGDTFFVHRGSTITFSTPRYAIAYKSAARHSH